VNRIIALCPLLFALGCTVTTGVPTGSVTFHWAFTSASYSCAYANVTSMQVQVGGTNGGVNATVGCYDPVNTNQGVTIDGVPAGSAIPFTLTAYTPTYDANGNFTGNVATYQASGTVSVLGGANNDTGVIQLGYINPPQNPANSNMVFLWNFAGQSCAATPQVAQVRVQVTDTVTPANSVDTKVGCNTAGTDGIQVQMFVAGTYPFTLTGLDSSGTAIYQASGSVTVDGVTSVNIHVSLAPTGAPTSGPGNAQFAFTFGTSGENCQQAGIDSLHFSLSDSTGAAVSGSDLIVGCMTSSGLTQQVQFNALAAPNAYFLSAQGLSGGNATYSGNFQFSVTPTVTSSYQIVIPKLQ
jgi:hypothetical protein